MSIKEKEYVFLVCAGRAGSGFLHSLLDSHPQILMLPMELKFHANWESLGCDRIKDVDEIVHLWCYSTKLIHLKKGIHYGYEQDKNSYTNCDFELFKSKFQKYLKKSELSRRNVFLALHYAYADGISQDINQVKIIIEFSAYPNWMKHSLEDFPQARFLHVVRDFRANFSSMKQHYLNSRRSLIDFSVPTFRKKFSILTILDSLNYIYFIKNVEKDIGGNKFCHIRLEDLHLSLEKKMCDICGYLDIEFKDSLLKSTLGGQSWLGNSSYGKSVQGVNPKILTRWKENLSQSEVKILNFLYADILKVFNYEIGKTINFFQYIFLVWIPFRREFSFVLPKGDFKIKGINPVVVLGVRGIRELVYYLGRLILYPISRIYLVQSGMSK